MTLKTTETPAKKIIYKIENVETSKENILDESEVMDDVLLLKEELNTKLSKSSSKEEFLMNTSLIQLIEELEKLNFSDITCFIEHYRLIEANPKDLRIYEGDLASSFKRNLTVYINSWSDFVQCLQENWSHSVYEIHSKELDTDFLIWFDVSTLSWNISEIIVEHN